MYSQPFTPPQFEEKAFNCPFCNAFAKQHWFALWRFAGGNNQYQVDDLFISICAHCNGYAIWYKKKIISPESSGAPYPNPDLVEDIKQDYLEARGIVNKSPRGAAAILRLCIQKLCQQLGEKGKDLNQDIGNLVKNGLSERIQKALDIVRVVGNNAVHPGTIDLKDNREIAIELFKLINIIAEIMISQPKKIDGLYESLPESKKEAITTRDNQQG
jgi:hypothetical protein